MGHARGILQSSHLACGVTLAALARLDNAAGWEVLK